MKNKCVVCGETLKDEKGLTCSPDCTSIYEGKESSVHFETCFVCGCAMTERAVYCDVCQEYNEDFID